MMHRNFIHFAVVSRSSFMPWLTVIPVVAGVIVSSIMIVAV